MTKIHPLPNGGILKVHVGEEAEYGTPSPGFNRVAKGNGWAIDLDDTDLEVKPKIAAPISSQEKPVAQATGKGAAQPVGKK